jgi:hypothetical protein
MRCYCIKQRRRKKGISHDNCFAIRISKGIGYTRTEWHTNTFTHSTYTTNITTSNVHKSSQQERRTKYTTNNVPQQLPHFSPCFLTGVVLFKTRNENPSWLTRVRLVNEQPASWIAKPTSKREMTMRCVTNEFTRFLRCELILFSTMDKHKSI